MTRAEAFQQMALALAAEGERRGLHTCCKGCGHPLARKRKCGHDMCGKCHDFVWCGDRPPKRRTGGRGINPAWREWKKGRA